MPPPWRAPGAPPGPGRRSAATRARLKVPLAASAAVPVGPVGHNARRVLALLRDRRRTSLVVVALPEEMAVVEAVQFHRLATEELGMEPVAVVLNGCHERRFGDADEAEVLARVRALDAISRQLPTSAALLQGLRSQAGSFDSHLEFAVEAMGNGDLEMAKRHAEHMVNIAEGELGEHGLRHRAEQDVHATGAAARSHDDQVILGNDVPGGA